MLTSVKRNLDALNKSESSLIYYDVTVVLRSTPLKRFPSDGDAFSKMLRRVWEGQTWVLLGRGGGKVVCILAYFSKDLSLNPTGI